MGSVTMLVIPMSATGMAVTVDAINIVPIILIGGILETTPTPPSVKSTATISSVVGD